MVLFIFGKVIFFEHKVKRLFKKHKVLFVIIILNLLSLSLSILNSINIFTFLQVFKNFIISYLIFVLILFYFTKRNDLGKFIEVLVFSSIINLSIQVFIYFDSGFFLEFLKNYMHPQGAAFLEYQLARSRFFGDSFEEAIIPLLIFLILKSNKIKKNFLLIYLFLLIIFITTSSNWRTKQLIFFFCFFLVMLYILIVKPKLNRFKVFIVFFVSAIIFFLSYILSLQIIGQNSIVRLIDPNDLDKAAIRSRLNMWLLALEIGKSYPLSGVGLGNYYEYLSTIEKYQINKFSLVNTKGYVLIDNPHNIFFSLFAETGFFGLFTYVILLVYFLFYDIKLLTKKNFLSSILIFSFWSLFLFSLFNPANGLTYLNLFWVLRAMIYLV